MLGDVAGLLVCPVCGADVALTGPALRCRAGHTFDVARQGYVNLMAGGARPGTADTPGMVAARAAFLDAGHYQPLAAALAALAAERQPDVVLDAGAGTGYYLAAVLDALRSGPGAGAVGVAMDISARALRRAARAAPGIGAIAWDTWRPFPVRSAAVSLILNVFAPRNAPEFHRVLRPGGTLIVVTPAASHLAELVAPAALLTVDHDKDSRLAATLGPYFTPAGRRTLTIPLQLTHPEAATLIAMGPSAHHTDPAATRQRLATLPDPVPVTASFDLTVYRPRPLPNRQRPAHEHLRSRWVRNSACGHAGRGSGVGRQVRSRRGPDPWGRQGKRRRRARNRSFRS